MKKKKKSEYDVDVLIFVNELCFQFRYFKNYIFKNNFSRICL